MKIYHDQEKLVRTGDDKILKYVKTNHVAKSTGFVNFRELTLVISEAKLIACYDHSVTKDLWVVRDYVLKKFGKELFK